MVRCVQFSLLHYSGNSNEMAGIGEIHNGQALPPLRSASMKR